MSTSKNKNMNTSDPAIIHATDEKNVATNIELSKIHLMRTPNLSTLQDDSKEMAYLTSRVRYCYFCFIIYKDFYCLSL